MRQMNLSQVVQDMDFTSCDSNNVALSTKIRCLAKKDRDILEKGSRAFISFVRAYKEHRCQYIFRLKELNLLEVAETFALLKLPRIRELKGMIDTGHFKQELTTFSDIEVVLVDLLFSPSFIQFVVLGNDSNRFEVIRLGSSVDERVVDAPYLLSFMLYVVC